VVPDPFEVPDGQQEHRHVVQQLFHVPEVCVGLPLDEVTDESLAGTLTQRVKVVVGRGDRPTGVDVVVLVGPETSSDEFDRVTTDSHDADIGRTGPLGRAGVLAEVPREVTDTFEVGEYLER